MTIDKKLGWKIAFWITATPAAILTVIGMAIDAATVPFGEAAAYCYRKMFE